MIKYTHILLLLIVPLFGFGKKTFYNGVDLSYLPELEAKGVKFYTKEGKEEDLLLILKSYGINSVRLRLWVDHKDCNLEKTLAFAKRIKEAKLSLLLDFHYSDNWTDPGKQRIPKAWLDLDFAALKKQVYDYTSMVLKEFKSKGLAPELVQIGNEINHGLLWEHGRRSVNDGKNMCELLIEGAEATRTILPKTKIMIHYAGIEGVERFYSTLSKHGVPYDIMGFSYYPWHHERNLTVFRNVMQSLGATYHKEVVIAETSYPWTLKENDQKKNKITNSEDILPEYKATQEGQYRFVKDWLDWLSSKKSHGVGFYYWAPDYVSHKGNTNYNGSPRDNLSFFDADNKPLKVLDAF